MTCKYPEDTHHPACDCREKKFQRLLAVVRLVDSYFDACFEQWKKKKGRIMIEEKSYIRGTPELFDLGEEVAEQVTKVLKEWNP